MEQNRWTSKAAWASLLGVIGLLLRTFGLYEKIGLTEESWQNIVTALLATLVAFGIFNDPTTKGAF